MKSKWIVLILFSFFAVNIHAQSQAYSLQQAQDYAAQNHNSTKAAALDVLGAQATVGEVLSTGLPQLSGSVDYTNFLKLPTSLIPAEFFGGEPGEFAEVQFGTKQNITAGLSFSQLLFNGSWLVGVNAAKTYVGLLESQQKLTEVDVRKNVELAYYTALVSSESENIWQKNIDNLSKTLNDVTALNKQGFVEEIDVDRLKISLSNLQTNLENVKRQTELAKTFLKFQIGIDVNQEIELTDSLDILQSDFIFIDNDQNYLSRPEFDILETTRILNDYNVRINKAGYYPSLVLTGSYQQNAQRNEFDFFNADQPWFETALVGVSLQVPIFDGLNKKHKIENAQIGLQKAELMQQTTTQAIQLEIAKAKTDYQNALNDLENQQSNITLAEKIYNVSLIKYQQGVGSSLELTSAESSLFQTQGAYIGALYNLLNAKANLKRALGY
ncbi:MAG: TolC family protein [Fimbriimonadaceae bacterium]|nr:TolC family protein [Chitinophagales bacterium]